MKGISTWMAGTAIALAMSAGAANAGDFKASVENYALGYIEAEIEIRNNTVERGSAFITQAGNVNLYARADTNDRYSLEVQNYAGGYIRQDLEAVNNTVSDESAAVFQVGNFNFATN